MKIKLLRFLGLALVGIHGMSAPADVPAMDGWTDALDVAIGKHEEYVAVREARIEALRQQLVQVGSETREFFRLNAEMYQEYKAYICDVTCAGRNSEVSRMRQMKPVSGGRI